MKDYFVMYYDIESSTVEEVHDIFSQLADLDAMKNKTLIVLPDIVTLKNYTKEELIELFNIYQKNIKELLNE